MSKVMKRGLVLALVLIAVSVVTIYYTVDMAALHSLEAFNAISIVLALLALTVGMIFDGLRLQRLVAIGVYDLPIRAVLRVIFGNYFMALLTPGASGGAVAQVLILKSYGVPLLKAAPIVLIRTVFSILFLVVMLPIVFWQTQVDIPYISQEVLMGLSFAAVVATFVGVYALQTKWLRQGIYWLLTKLKKGNPKSILQKLDSLNEGLSLLYKHPKQSLVVFIESGLSLLSLYCIAPALMYAFAPTVPLWPVLQLMIVLNLILYFAPTPGGTGVAEGLFILLFAPFVPQGTVGIVAVAWRVIAEYLPFFIGMYAVLTLYGAQFIAKANEPKN